MKDKITKLMLELDLLTQNTIYITADDYNSIESENTSCNPKCSKQFINIEAWSISAKKQKKSFDGN